MSTASKPTASPSALGKPVPVWIGAGLIGLILGAGGTLIVIKAKAQTAAAITENADGSVRTPPISGPPPGMGGGTMGAGAMGGGMGMMMGMGGGGGGGARGTKRNLTSLVGELDLLTRETLHVELTAEQTAKLAEHLAKLDHAEKMSGDEAQAELDAITALLTPEQKALTDAISLPFGRPGGGGGPGAPGGGGGGFGGPGGPPAQSGMGPGGGPSEDENPFHQEVNQKRLRELLTRIRPAPSEPAKAEPAQPETSDKK